MTHRRFLFSLTIFSLLFIFIITPFSTRAAFKIGAPLTTVKNGLVGHWTFDGKDTNWNTKKTNDLSGNGKHGTITNMSTTTSPVAGRLGQGFHFDGVNDYITMGDINQSAYTVALWVKPDREINASISDGGSGGDVISFDDGYVGIGLGSQTGAFANEIITVLASLPDNPRSAWTSTTDHISPEWHHITAVWNASTGFYDIYFDGVKKNNITSGSSPGVLDIAELIIGAQQDPEGVLAYFKGSIDDVRIYSRAISATEVSRLYRHGSRIKQNTSFSLGTLASGLVGHWTFDGKDTNWGTQKTNDISGNANHGTITNMSTSSSPTAGRLGQGLRFDGVNDIVSFGDILDDTFAGADKKFSMSLWIKPNHLVGTRYLVTKYADSNCSLNARQFDLAAAGDKVRFEFLPVLASGAYRVIRTTNTSLVAQKWQHVVVTYDGSIDTNDGLDRVKLYVDNADLPTELSDTLGGLGDILDGTAHLGLGYILDDSGNSCGDLDNRFAGSLDDVRIYNRALSASEITQLYRQGAGTRTAVTPPSIQTGLVGHWTFDGKDTNWGTNKTNDRSGNANHGTITNMSTSTSPTPGRLGQGLKFDGVDDYVDFGASNTLNTNTALTIGLWFKKNGRAGGGVGYHGLVQRFNASVQGYQVYIPNSTNLLRFYTNTDVASTFTLSDSRWHYYTVTNDGSMTRFYVDGMAYGTASQSLVNVTSSTVNNIGVYPLQGISNGSIDDVRIYNRVLLAGEVKALYNIGR